MSSEKIAACRCCDIGPGLERGEGGHAVGCDPREMSREELIAVGHEPMSALKALRARCVDCCAGPHQEVRLCTAVRCPSWPFRMGSGPWRAPMSEERRGALLNNLREARRTRSGAHDLEVLTRRAAMMGLGQRGRGRPCGRARGVIE